MDRVDRVADTRPVLMMPSTFRALPDRAPLDMPVQDLSSASPAGRMISVSRAMALRRVLVVGGAIVLTGFATHEMRLVLGGDGVTGLEGLILCLFVALYAWIALSLISAFCGFVSLIGRGGRALEPYGAPLPTLQRRTALLMPTYNEDPARVAAALQAIIEDLRRIGALDAFDIFILSDTTDPDVWIAEEAGFLALRQRIGDTANLYYRRRALNIERKAGNISEWVRNFGAAYDHMLVLDADSVMTADALVRLAGMMERHPHVGLIQTLPVITGGDTLFARMQQFAGRVYGPMIAHGIAWWHGSEGNYWGHNAIIRTAAFAAHAGLPVLRGRKPFGGHILSHDFVEAALLRRAGWAVHMMPALAGSYEQSPPSLPEVAIRDRRWCQGNLQHVGVLGARGLHWVSRLHLLMGIGSYITSPLWLLFLLVGGLISLRAGLVLPVYFPTGPSLFPLWPSIDPVRSMWVFIVTLGVLLGPKLLGYVALLLDRQERRGCGGAIRALLSVLVETLLAGLIAPVAMLTQSAAVTSILAGRDSGWQPQRRDDGAISFGVFVRHYRGHTLLGIALGVCAWLVSPSLLLWMSPVVLGLGLAIPLAAFTAKASVGSAFRRLGLLRIPEETSPPAILLQVKSMHDALRTKDLAVENGLEKLTADDDLIAAHLAMLPPARRPGIDPLDAGLLMGKARLSEARDWESGLAGLTKAEKLAVLGDADALALALRLRHAQARQEPRSNAALG